MKNSDLYSASIVNPYNSWSDSKMSLEALRIQDAMTGNPRFPNPVPSMEVFSASVGDYVLALAKAGTRDENAVAAKNARRKALTELCIQLGYSVAGTANGDVEALVSTALPMRKKNQPVVLTPPQNLRITNGINPGDLDLRVDGMKGASSFGFEYTEDPPTENSEWIKTICTTSRCTVKGLSPGKKYWFRTFVIGAKGAMIMGETLLSPFVQ